MIQVWKESDGQFPDGFLVRNGDTVLMPSSCELTAELNGSWELVLKQPVLDDGRFKLIEPGGIIQADSFNGTQWFRILKTELDRSEIIAYAYPIFMDAMNWVFIPELNLVDKSGKDAAAELSKLAPSGTLFSVSSDITDVRSLNLKNVNLITAINGDDEDSESFVNTYHGQVIYNNTTAVVNKIAGSDNGVVLRFGKNVNGITRTLSRENFTTRLFPISKDGYSMTTVNPWVDADEDYEGIPYARSVSLENLEVEGLSEAVRNESLRNTALSVFLVESLSGNPLNQEEISYDIDIAVLSNTSEYKTAGVAETLSLGDIVTVKDDFMGINYKAQVTKLTYDCIKGCATSVTVGQDIKNYFNLNSLRTISKDVKSWTIEDVNL